MVKKTIIFLLAILLLPAIFASTLELNVKTLPDHDVFINLAEPSDSGYNLIKSIKENSGPEGKVSTIFDSSTFSSVKVYVQVNKNGEKVLFYNFGIKSMNEPLYLQVIPGEIYDDYRPYEPVESENISNLTEANETAENATVEETANTTEQPDETADENATLTNTITGFVTLDKLKVVPKSAFWIAGIAIIVVIVILFFLKRSSTPISLVPHPPRALAPQVGTAKIIIPQKQPEPLDEELSKVEQELKDAETKIEKMKKIKDAKRRLTQEKEELKQIEEED